MCLFRTWRLTLRWAVVSREGDDEAAGISWHPWLGGGLAKGNVTAFAVRGMAAR